VTNERRIIVSLTPAATADPHAWMESLVTVTAVGLTVTRILQNIGVICGSVPSTAVYENLRRLECVSAVEDDQSFTAGTS
jgi:hypothetical protein